jgi:hypothetical protein
MGERSQPPEWLTTEFLGRIVEWKINCREIKNIFRIGHALTQEKQRDMTNISLLWGLEASKQFDMNLCD